MAAPPSHRDFATVGDVVHFCVLLAQIVPQMHGMMTSILWQISPGKARTIIRLNLVCRLAGQYAIAEKLTGAVRMLQ